MECTGGHPLYPLKTRQRKFGAKKPPQTERQRPTGEKEVGKETRLMKHAGEHPPHPPKTRQKGTEKDREERNRESEEHSSAPEKRTTKNRIGRRKEYKKR